ncbi:hypothetical protein Vadar_013388 [Vaccinium darrowii]|uniref:Uncharacterized protein n=1 Tax=Vaccinium darrowii TaxID=229202 RepID=A0ACB7ZB96_9ERIC|nr:hypothetical protein Vadar_013388 [Vaccinium darrowii]
MFVDNRRRLVSTSLWCLERYTAVWSMKRTLITQGWLYTCSCGHYCFAGAEVILQQLVDLQLLCSKNQVYVKGLVRPFGLVVLASEDFIKQTAIFFCIFISHSKYVVLMCSDQSRSSLRYEAENNLVHTLEKTM